MRHAIDRLVSRTNDAEPVSRVYNLLMIVVAVLSVAPLAVRQQTYLTRRLDLWTVYILFVDYVLRWICADYDHPKLGKWAFVLYPLLPVSLLSFISLLPSLGLLHDSLRILRLFRLVIIFHYSRNFLYIANVFKKEKNTLLTVLWIALGYILISALVMFVCDPETFPAFFDAVYWATTALTTVGYGDIYPHNDIGRAVSMISSLFGIAIIALPAGIITAGFMGELESARQKGKEKKTEKKLLSAEKEIEELQSLLTAYLKQEARQKEETDHEAT